jgi:arylsulfatase
MYIRWFADNMWTFVPAQAITAKFLMTFKEFPPVMGSSLGIDKVLKTLTSSKASGQ